MKSFSTFRLLVLCGLGVASAGCRDNGPLTPVDLAMTGGGGDMASGGGGGGGGDMGKTYTPATIKAMRQGAPGNYQLVDVVGIALTSSSSSPHLFVQDADGGDFSAIKTNCSSSTTTTHPCTVGTTVKTIAIGHKVTITGLYIKAGATNGGTEDFYIDSINDNGAGTVPAAAAVMLADVQRGAQSKKFWFQHVEVTNPGTLVAYDLSPTELKFNGATKCFYQLGFGLIPMTSAPAMAPAGCTGMTQPAPVASPDAAEVLIGTEFYKDFNVSSDCQCATTAKPPDTLITNMTKTTGKVAGILDYDSVFGSMPVKTYQYLAPMNLADLPLQ